MNKIIKKIKSRGYWRINFRPLIHEEKLSQLSKCKDIVEKNVIQLRGWDYPHFPRRKDVDTSLDPGSNYYEGWVDWRFHKEFWRMYQSGQFINYRGLWEDWHDEEHSFLSSEPKILKMVNLGVSHTIFQITEIYEFLLGLVKESVYREGLKLSIILCNTENRKLWLEESLSLRIPFMEEKNTIAQSIEFKKEYSEMEVIENSSELAIVAILHFFARFDWMPSEDLIRKDQQDFLKRRR